MPYGTLALDAISTSGNLSVTGNLTANTHSLVSQTLGTATPGRFEYDGKVPYFTPAGTQRGVVPGMQYFRLDSAVAGANATGAQNFFGVGVTVSSNIVYAFDSVILISKTSGATSHTVSVGFGGTFANNNIIYQLQRQSSTSGFSTAGGDAVQGQTFQTATLTTWTGARGGTIYYDVLNLRGTVSVSTGGTFIPQYSLSAAPGGAYTTAAGSYFLIYPIGAAGSNISVGSWA